MSIKQALDHIPETIRLMIGDYQADLDDAWIHRGDDEGLTISFSAKLSVDPKKGNQCDVSISFVKEKIKDKKSFSWDEKQGNLFEPPLGPGESVTISSGNRSVTIEGPAEETQEEEAKEEEIKIPCLDCQNDGDNGGNCDRSNFYVEESGKFVCDEMKPRESQNQSL